MRQMAMRLSRLSTPVSHNLYSYSGKIHSVKVLAPCKKRNSPRVSIRASLLEFSPTDIAIERLLGSYGFMNVFSITPGPSPSSSLGVAIDENKAAGYDFRDINRMSGIQVGNGSFETKMYKGRIVKPGRQLGTRVILKVYPGLRSGGSDADSMAANELLTHAILQDEVESEKACPHIAHLMGGFQSNTGEQWLVFRDDGIATAFSYAQAAAQATRDGVAVGEWELFDRFDPSRPLARRRRFIVEILRGVMAGLAFSHSRGRLHQSLGPASVLLNTCEEREVAYLLPRLRDFAFSVDISSDQLLTDDDQITGEIAAGLWRRARAAGAKSAMERKAFAIADDIYGAGLFLAYMTFVPLSLPGSMDGQFLQRLFEVTFRLDLRAARDYCAADERWTEAVNFLDQSDGAGWNLLQAMLNPEYRLRPTAASVLNHPFLSLQ